MSSPCAGRSCGAPPVIELAARAFVFWRAQPWLGADVECAPPSNLSGPCGLGSTLAVASGLVVAAFAMLSCGSVAVVVDGFWRLVRLLSFCWRFARAMTSGSVATCTGCSCAVPCFLTARRGAKRGEDGLYPRAEASGC